MTTTFGTTLTHLCAIHDTNQSQLGRASGITHSHISRLMSGTRKPARETVERLANALSLSIAECDSLFTAAGFLPPSGTTGIYGLQPDYATALARFWDGVDADTNPVNVNPTAIRAAAASLRLARTEEAA